MFARSILDALTKQFAKIIERKSCYSS